MTRPALALRAYHLLVRKRFRSSAYGTADWVPRDCMHKTAFPNMKYMFLTYYKKVKEGKEKDV